MALILDAPAKLNLYLAVLGRRADGYHEVETILHEIALRDTLVAELAELPADQPVQLTVDLGEASGTGLPVASGDDNLVCRAARRFLAECAPAAGEVPGVRFHLTKRIPAGAGLGGGSSDAAAALLLLNRLCGDPVDAAELHRIAAELGADVPFFLAGGTQLGRGTGTELTVLADAPSFHFLLILPPLGTSTEAIYKNHAAHLTPVPQPYSIPRDKVPAVKEIAVASGFRNDLEASALQLHTGLADLRDRVIGLGHPKVRMSGSGSTFFLTFSSEAECMAARDDLAPVSRDGVRLLRTSSSHSHRQPIPGAFPGGY